MVIKYYEELFNKYLKDPNVGFNDELFILTDLYLQISADSKIENYLKKLVSNEINGAYNELAWFYVSTENDSFKKYEEAFKLANKAVELTNRQNPNVLDTLAEAYYVNGDKNMAIKINNEAKSIAKRKDIVNHLDEQLKKYEDKQ